MLGKISSEISILQHKLGYNNIMLGNYITQKGGWLKKWVIKKNSTVNLIPTVILLIWSTVLLTPFSLVL